MKKTYIVAGCRPWNQTGIEYIQNGTEADVVGVCQPDELKEVIAQLEGVRYIFFLHWSHIVPDEIIKNYECVCFHMTDVPFGRGGSPLQNLIVRGYRDTKLTALLMKSEIDAGPVYLKRELSLEGSSAEEIYMRAESVSCEMILEIIETELKPIEQSGEVTIFKRRRPEDSRIEGDKSLLEVHDFIRMLDASGYPNAYLEFGGLRMEFSRSTLYNSEVKTEVSITKI